MSKNLEVIGVTKKMLSEAIDKNTYWKNNLAPLPKSKAIWLVSNSRIQDDDYCGVMGYEDEKMISFIFMFPDFLNTSIKKENKIYWMISWWVHPTYKDTVLGTYIFNEALNLADKQIVIKSYAENVNAFYEKQPFTVIASRLRHTIFFSLDASMLIGRFRFLKSFRFILNKVDAFSQAVLNRINTSRYKNRTKGLVYDFISKIDNDTWEFIEPLCSNDLIYKTKEYINWHIDNNQYLQTPVVKLPYRSLQTGISDNIHIHSVKIIKENTIIGFLSYIINFNEFNVKYFLVKDESYYDICVDALIENFIKVKKTFIFTDDTKLSETIAKRYKTIFTHKVLKKGLAHNETGLDIESVDMLNRDGHFY